MSKHRICLLLASILASASPSMASVALFATWDGTSTLTVSIDGPFTITVNSASGNVKVNGSDPLDGSMLPVTVPASSVQQINITGSSGPDIFDTTGVTSANGFTFTGLVTNISGQAGNDQFNTGEYFDSINTGSGADSVNSGDGADLIVSVVDGLSDVYIGGAGDPDQLDFGDTTTRSIDYDFAASGADLIISVSGAETQTVSMTNVTMRYFDVGFGINEVTVGDCSTTALNGLFCRFPNSFAAGRSATFDCSAANIGPSYDYPVGCGVTLSVTSGPASLAQVNLFGGATSDIVSVAASGADAVVTSGPSTITLAENAQINFYGGLSADTLTVGDLTGTGVQFVLAYNGDGDDVNNVTVQAVAGFNCIGEANTDTLNIDLTGLNYTDTPSSVTATGCATVNHSTFENVNLLNDPAMVGDWQVLQ